MEREREPTKLATRMNIRMHPRRCKISSIGQSAGLLIPRFSVHSGKNTKN